MNGPELRKQCRKAPGRGACGVHMSLQVAARAGGAGPFAVRADFAQRHAVRLGLVGQKTIKSFRGLGCRVLDLEVAEHENTKVPRVVVFDMCALQVDWAGLPDSALRIDDEVVADVGPAAVVHMRRADHLDTVCGIGLRADRNGRHAVVVDGDRLDPNHRVGLRDDGLVACPLRALHNALTGLARSRGCAALAGWCSSDIGALFMGPERAGQRTRAGAAA